MDLPALDSIRLDLRDGVLTITLDRPDRLNAFNHPMHQSLVVGLTFARDCDAVQVIVLTGAGRAFSAGGDMSAISATVDEFARESNFARRLVQLLVDCDKPMICRLNGDAIGLGASVALLCDIVVAADTARLGDPHVRMGLVAGDGGALIWPMHAGMMAAKYYLLTGDLLPAEEAKSLGLITFVTPPEELDAKVDSIAAKLANGAPLAIRWTKRAVNAAIASALPAVFEQGLALEGLSMVSQDHAEARAAFLAKRKPVFRGR